MSTTDGTATFEPIPGTTVEGVILEALPRTDGPEKDLRVDVDGSTWRVSEGEIER